MVKQQLATSSTQELIKIDNFVIFTTKTGKVNIDIFFAQDTLWLTQKLMAKLFETTKQNISFHLQNIFKEGELDKNSVVKIFLTTASDGKTTKLHFILWTLLLQWATV